MSALPSRVLATLLLGVVVAACSSALESSGPGSEADSTAGGDIPLEVDGVIVDVNGTLQGIESFTVLTSDGERMVFGAAPDLLFEGGPLSHLRDHLASGAPIEVGYQPAGDGAHMAVYVGDSR